MKHWSVLFIHLFGLQISLSVCDELRKASAVENYPNCPPWFFYNDSVNQCQCFETFNLDIKCSSEGALLSFGRCMTYQEGMGAALSLCPYFLIDGFLDNVTEGLFITLPSNVTQLNDYMCQPLNRKGYQCSECFDGFGVSLTSLGYLCSNCIGVWYGIPLYLFLEFVPITVFYILILVYRVNLTSAPMTSFIMLSQLIAYAITLNPENHSVGRVLLNKGGFGLLNFIVALYGIWNLDFFRYIVPPFCVSPNLELIHVLFMSYISALYPICLIIVTWIWLELVSRGYKPLVWIWKTIGRCCFGAKWKWEKKRTIVDAFATFLLLSYTKLLIQSLVIIVPSRIQLLSITGNYSQVTRSFDLGIEYFGTKHLPFAIFALIILIAFVILPALLLALFPFKAFRSLLSKIKLLKNRKAAFYLFVEKFYSCYRDGLSGGKDMRGLASFYFFLRFILLLVQYQPTLEVIGRLSGRGTGDAEVATQFLQAALLATATILIGIVRPYKKAYMNILDTTILSILTLLLFYPLVYLYALTNIDSRIGNLLFYSSITVLCLPPVGFGVYLFVRFYRSKRPLTWLQHQCADCKRKRGHNASSRQTSVVASGIAANLESLPDRFIHPDLYYIEAEDSF